LFFYSEITKSIRKNTPSECDHYRTLICDREADLLAHQMKRSWTLVATQQIATIFTVFTVLVIDRLSACFSVTIATEVLGATRSVADHLLLALA
jgi:hypothetical protein